MPETLMLFDAERVQGASFSEDRVYRYSLFRRWGEAGAPRLVVIGLNPSTADETVDDPTIRRCVGFAKREGLSGLLMLNLFAVRATDPRVMLAHPDPVGPLNDTVIRTIIDPADTVVAAWGVHGMHMSRGGHVAKMLRPRLQCLGRTKAGFPRHPLYLRADAALEPYP